MIILIAGASHTGKTVLAQRMLEKYGYPYMSIDHLKMGLIRSSQTDLTPDDDDELTSYLWPVVREIIKTAIENDQNLIIEGCYIPYNWRDDLTEDYLSDIKFVCLAMSEKYIDSDFETIAEHGSDIEKRIYPSCDRAWLKAENNKCIEGFGKAGEQVVLIDEDYEETINSFLDRF